MRLTGRDVEIVEWVAEVGVATRWQIQGLFFTRGGRSRCQHRLTGLVRNRFLDRMPGRPVSQPDVYRLSRKSVNGLRLLRARGIELRGGLRLVSPARLRHTLEVANCRVQLIRACAETGVRLAGWLEGDHLASVVGSGAGLIPDAFAQLSRIDAGGEERKSSFCIEVERSTKSDRLLREKFRRYGQFYYGGGFTERFQVRALRVLFLIASDYGIDPERRIAHLFNVAQEAGVTFLLFAPLDAFLALDPARALVSDIWKRPGHDRPVAIFGPESVEADSDRTRGE